MTKNTPNKTPVRIAAVITMILLFFVAVLSVLLEMVALNGASEKQGMFAIGTSLLCNGLGIVLFGLFSGWFTKFVMARFNWNPTLAVVIAVAAGVIIGSAASLLSLMLSIPLAGIQ
ncbi:MAG: hypothetical protein K8S20_13920 [Chloroflexi bacterium]|nr:hypothetical protein [Chloroflexota bacterium]